MLCYSIYIFAQNYKRYIIKNDLWIIELEILNFHKRDKILYQLDPLNIHISMNFIEKWPNIFTKMFA